MDRRAVLLSFLLLWSCGGEGRRDGSYLDLVASFPEAAKRVQTDSIVFGTPQARHHLVSGWAGDELDASRQETYVSNTGLRSVLRFERLQSEYLSISLLCRAWRGSTDRPQTLSVELNGDPLERLRLSRVLKTYRLDLPTRSVRPGENLLSFEYDPIDDGQVRGRNRRSLAVAWYRIDFGGSSRVEPPAVDAARDQLYLPYGSEIAYVTYLRPGSALVADRLGLRGAAGAAQVLLETDSEGLVRIGELHDGQGIELALRPGGSSKSPPQEAATRLPARVVIRARATDPSLAEGGLVLHSPRLSSSAPIVSTPPVAALEPARRGRPPNIIFYLIDTLRRDRLGAYGYPRPISPNLDALAESAVLFENAVGQSSWTRASIASMFTGMWPGAHGAIGRRDKLAPEAHTLAEALQTGGYHTTAFITNPNVERTFGFQQGFDDFIHVRRGTASNRVNERVFQWLDGYEGDKPFFLYIHTVDPHDPYLPPKEFRSRWAPDSEAFVEIIRAHTRRQTWEPTPEVLENLSALYDAEIAFNDHSFGALVASLRERGLYDDALILVVSDHGEEFYDHGRWTHGKGLFVETLNFPLIVKFPGQTEGRRARRPVQHVDLMPTLLAFSGISIPQAVEGESFADWARSEGTDVPGVEPPIFSHLHLDGPLYLSVVDDGWKLIQRRVEAQRVQSMLFHLTEDPLEREDRLEEFPVRGALLAALLEAKLRRQDHALTTEEAVLDPELEESLRALGYLQ